MNRLAELQANKTRAETLSAQLHQISAQVEYTCENIRKMEILVDALYDEAHQVFDAELTRMQAEGDKEAA